MQYNEDNEKSKDEVQPEYKSIQQRNPPEAWMCVSPVLFVVAGRDPCDGPITRPGELYRM
jgi:hypothetical protein